MSNIVYFFRHDRLLLSESGTGFYLVELLRVTSLINGDRSHIGQMQNGNILYTWRANIVVVNNILISPVNQNKWKTSDAKIWSEF